MLNPDDSFRWQGTDDTELTREATGIHSARAEFQPKVDDYRT
jgi:hypothetical protein